MKIAITGRSATGKSSFINQVRGVKSNDTSYARSGRGNTTMSPTSYSHPRNNRIVFWDLPGVGTKNFKRGSYVKDVNMEVYDIFLLFVEYALREDDESIASELKRLKKPFCLVRSKIDDIKNAKDDGTEEDGVIPSVQKQLNSEISDCPVLKDCNVFLISSKTKMFGDWDDLVSYIETGLTRSNLEVLMNSISKLASDAIEKNSEDSRAEDTISIFKCFSVYEFRFFHCASNYIKRGCSFQESFWVDQCRRINQATKS